MTEDTNLNPGAEVSSAKQWKATSDDPIPLQVPSGNVCLARAPGMQHFVKAGMVPNSLLPIVVKALQTGTPPDMTQVEKDGEKVNDMIKLADNVICQVVIEPRVHPVPPQENTESDKYDPDFERDTDLLYVDEVSVEDKAFIFQWACGGTSDIEQFRVEAEQSMGAAPSRKNVQRPAKRTGGAKSRKR